MFDRMRVRSWAAAAVVLGLTVSTAWAAGTATFTADEGGTFPNTVKYDGQTGVLTVDLSGLCKDATIFRAELMLNPPRQGPRPFKPTTVYPVGQPEKKLKFVAPRFVSLDALDAVRAAAKEGRPLELKLDSSLAGARRLEVSYLEGKPKATDLPTVGNLKVIHRKGQSLLVFAEPKLSFAAPVTAPFAGSLKSVHAEAGQGVKKGDVLARLDTTELQRKLAAAEAERAGHVDRAEQLKRDGKGPEAQAAQREANKVARTIKALESQIAKSVVRAPIDGTVVAAKPAPEAGAAVRAGQRLFQVEGRLGPGSYPDLANGAEVGRLRQELVRQQAALSFRIWRGPERITSRTIAKARLVGECGSFTAWNSGYHQGGTPGAVPVRYRVTDGGQPVAWGTGIYAHNPARAGKAYYAVTVAAAGEEDFGALGAGNTTAEAVEEVVGMGEPILQWIEQPDRWLYRHGPLVRLIYTRWESWGPPADAAKPHASTPSKPIDYLVAVPLSARPEGAAREPQYRAFRVEPAPVGLHLHCWGASLNGGYGWWYNAHRGAVLIASNQIPYDWWTGYHEALGTCKTFGDGHVRPFTMNRTFGFLGWATTQWNQAPEAVRKYWPKLDRTRVFAAGSSMGGSGAPMFAVRYGGRVAWCVAWVGVHIPAESPQFTGSYRGNYGPRHAAITMADGATSPWDHFSDVWWLRKNVKAETGFIMASNGKSDGGIGWPQAYKFARALQETRRPHLYNWGPGGHGTRTVIGANFNLDVRTDQTLPAFTNCTLDEDIGTATKRPDDVVEAERQRLMEQARQAGRDPKRVSVTAWDGDHSGAYNRHLWWETNDVVDTPQAWEMTVILTAGAPKDSCKVDLTPRRLQEFTTPNGKQFKYTVTDLQSGEALKQGTAAADEHDLLTLKQIPLVKGKNRVKIVPGQ